MAWDSPPEQKQESGTHVMLTLPRLTDPKLIVHVRVCVYMCSLMPGRVAFMLKGLLSKSMINTYNMV